VTKAEAWRIWSTTVVRRRGKYYTRENGRWVRATSWPKFWDTVQRLARLGARDPGGDIIIR